MIWSSDVTVLLDKTEIHPPTISVGGSGVLNLDMKASPTVSDHCPSHPYLSRSRN